jgi:hypothetical protein
LETRYSSPARRRSDAQKTMIAKRVVVIDL